MDLKLVMAELKPGENVSPDLSSYNGMVIGWRGSGNPPTLQEVETKWTEIEAQYNKEAKEHEVQKQLADSKANLQARVDALWEKVMDADSTKADELKVIVDDIKK